MWVSHPTPTQSPPEFDVCEHLARVQDAFLGEPGIPVARVPSRVDMTSTPEDVRAELEGCGAAALAVEFIVLGAALLDRHDFGHVVAQRERGTIPLLGRTRRATQSKNRSASLLVVDLVLVDPGANNQPSPSPDLRERVRELGEEALGLVEGARGFLAWSALVARSHRRVALVLNDGVQPLVELGGDVVRRRVDRITSVPRRHTTVRPGLLEAPSLTARDQWSDLGALGPGGVQSIARLAGI
jgi:hypothetical protein